LAGCAFPIEEANLLRPFPSGLLSQEALAAAALPYVTTHVAANRPTAGVVLESSATTTEDWVKERTKGLPVKVRLAESLKGRGNLRYMNRLDEPMLLIVGEKDNVTPPRLSQGLYEASSLPASGKTLTMVPGAGHTDAMRHPFALQAYRGFLASHRE
jgi:fermentation-respiration switch protein FrsA (DUF1100 family)